MSQIVQITFLTNVPPITVKSTETIAPSTPSTPKRRRQFDIEDMMITPRRKEAKKGIGDSKEDDIIVSIERDGLKTPDDDEQEICQIQMKNNEKEIEASRSFTQEGGEENQDQQPETT